MDYRFDELAHAYAVIIHRSQGSEYPAVVLALTTSLWLMLQGNLLYTGVTRAKKLVVLAGSRRALAAAVRTSGRRPRATLPWPPAAVAPGHGDEAGDRRSARRTLDRDH